MTAAATALADAAGSAPRSAGVYCFLDAAGDLVYVGKAADIRRRLQNHVAAGRAARSPRDRARVGLVAEVRWTVCDDEEAAAALEADLIVAFRPLMNASHATDGRWVFVVTTSSASHLRFRLVTAAVASAASVAVDGRGSHRYGCFPHLGTGLSSPRGIACSEGYAAFLRLVWAAGEADVAAAHPRAIAGPSPPEDVTLPFDHAAAPAVHRLLSGTSPRLLDELVARADRRPPYMRPALRRDGDAALGFYRHGPRAVRDLRLAHGRTPGPLDRSEIIGLLTADLRSAIGEVGLPTLDDPADGLLGARTGRALARELLVAGAGLPARPSRRVARLAAGSPRR